MRISQKLFVPALLGCAAMSLPSVAAAEVIEAEDTHFVTRDARTVSTDPYETWSALITPGKWWNDSHTWSGDAENMYLSAQGGGCFCELLPVREDAPDGIRRGSTVHMMVVQAAPPLVLRMRGGLGPLQSEPAEGVLTVTLKPVDGGTRILWEYVVGGPMRFEVPVIAKAVDGVMSQQLAGLASFLGEIEDEGADEAGTGSEESSEDEEDGAAENEDTSSEEDDDSADEDSTDEPSGDDDNAEGEEEGGDEAVTEAPRVLSLEEAIDQMAGSDEE